MPHCPGKRGPHYFGARLDLQPRIAQFKANAQLLPRTHRRHHLNSNAAVCEIAHDPAVRLIERDVGKCAEFVPVLRSCLTRGEWVLRPYSPPEVAVGQRYQGCYPAV